MNATAMSLGDVAVVLAILLVVFLRKLPLSVSPKPTLTAALQLWGWVENAIYR